MSELKRLQAIDEYLCRTKNLDLPKGAVEALSLKQAELIFTMPPEEFFLFQSTLKG